MGANMFDVKLVDIDGDGQVVEFSSILETLAEVELLIKETINRHLHTTDVELVHDEELVYEVFSDGCSVGLVQIVSI